LDVKAKKGGVTVQGGGEGIRKRARKTYPERKKTGRDLNGADVGVAQGYRGDAKRAQGSDPSVWLSEKRQSGRRVESMSRKKMSLR